MINIVSLLFAISLFFFFFYEKTSINEWRGPGREGIYPESNLLKKWPEGGPKEIWSTAIIGNGYGSPVITDSKIFVTGEIDSLEVLFSFNLHGELQWRTIMGREWTKSLPGSRSTPTVAGDLIYVSSGLGNLYCINGVTGKIIWSKDLQKDFNGELPLHGHSESPLLCENKVFLTTGGTANNVVALDRFTGRLIWSNKGFGERSAYHSPKLIELHKRKILVTFSAYHMMGLDIESGKLLWAHEQDNIPSDKRIPGNGDTHSNTVLFDNGSIYYCEGDGNCSVRLSLSADGNSITQVWRNRRFDGFMGGIVKIGDFIYGCGSASPDLRVIKASTGELTDSLRIGIGTIICADNMLYYYTQKGDMVLIGYNNGKITKVSSFEVKEGTYQHFSHPVIHEGMLYLRHGKVLMAYDIRKK